MLTINIVFAADDFKFIKELVQHFEQHPDFHVKTDDWSIGRKMDENQRLELLQWADVIVAEWCLEHAVWYANHKLPRQKLFVRLHRYEMNLKFAEMLHIDNVEKVIFIAPYIRACMMEKLPSWEQKSILIYNAVDTNRYRLPKVEEARFNIGLLGVSRKWKRLDKAVALFEKLMKKDSRYTLYLKGEFPDKNHWLWRKQDQREHFEMVYEQIRTSPFKDSIILENWDNDVHSWFRKIGFVLSTSDIEGSHQAIAEGMASGTIPIICGDWRGSELIYPEHYIKRDPDEAVETILRYTKNKMLYAQEQKLVMIFTRKHFQLENITQQWMELICKSFEGGSI